MKKIIIASLSIFSLFSWNCESDKPIKNDRAVIGVSADVENLNPLYAFGLLEGNIRELMFLGLVKYRWNEEMGDLDPHPLLAEKWEWDKDSTSLIFYLRSDLYWSDSTKLTADDVVFSFDLYSDAEVNSTFYGGYEKFFTDKDNQIDLKKSFEVLAPNKIKINFKPGTKPSLFDVDMPILPKQVFSKIPRKDMSTTNVEKNLVTNGPFTLSSWKKNEAVILKAAKNCFLYDEQMVKNLIFKIIPDENSRITQLKRGEIDLIEDVNVEAIAELKNIDRIKIVARKGRDFDYIGWSNIDPLLYSQNKVRNPNKFFGSAAVRKALSYAVNKEEILKEYLQGFGQLCFGPIAPIYKTYYNSNLQPYEYNPAKAKDLLKSEGWIDSDKDGILERNNEEFSFKLYIGSGNPRRAYAATVVKNNLKAVGINASIETMEMGAFINKLFEHELDAWMAGWTVPIPLDVQPYWHSNLERSPFNLYGFNDANVDKILDDLENETNREKKEFLYKKLQELLHQNEPITFLYWLDVKSAYNSRIENIRIDPLGAIQLCWEWRIKE